MDRHLPGSGDVRIENAQQLQVDLTIRSHVEILISVPMNVAVPDNVGAFTHQMRQRDMSGLISVGERDRPLVVELGVFQFDRDVGPDSLHCPLRGIAQRAPQRDRAARRGVASKLPAQIGTPYRIKIEVIRLGGDVRGEVAMHSDASGQLATEPRWKSEWPLRSSSPPLVVASRSIVPDSSWSKVRPVA